MKETYKIVRRYKDGPNSLVIYEGLTLKEAQELCPKPWSEEKGKWFDSFEKE